LPDHVFEPQVRDSRGGEKEAEEVVVKDDVVEAHVVSGTKIRATEESSGIGEPVERRERQLAPVLVVFQTIPTQGVSPP
jgi:hypothetical protein